MVYVFLHLKYSWIIFVIVSRFERIYGLHYYRLEYQIFNTSLRSWLRCHGDVVGNEYRFILLIDYHTHRTNFKGTYAFCNKTRCMILMSLQLSHFRYRYLKTRKCNKICEKKAIGKYLLNLDTDLLCFVVFYHDSIIYLSVWIRFSVRATVGHSYLVGWNAPFLKYIFI